jgi:hypothetical protein
MHETTGNKPAKTEMTNKPNMYHKPQHTNTPNPENLKLTGSRSLKLGYLNKFSFFA